MSPPWPGREWCRIFLDEFSRFWDDWRSVLDTLEERRPEFYREPESARSGRFDSEGCLCEVCDSWRNCFSRSFFRSLSFWRISFCCSCLSFWSFFCLFSSFCFFFSSLKGFFSWERRRNSWLKFRKKSWRSFCSLCCLCCCLLCSCFCWMNSASAISFFWSLSCLVFDALIENNLYLSALRGIKFGACCS